MSNQMNTPNVPAHADIAELTRDRNNWPAHEDLITYPIVLIVFNRMHLYMQIGFIDFTPIQQG